MSLDSALPQETLDDLFAIGDVSNAQVADLKLAFSAIVDRIETPEGLLAVAMSVIDDIAIVSPIVKQLLSINQFSRQVGRSVRDLLDSELREAVPDSCKSGKDETRLNRAIEALLSLCDLVVFQRTSKAIELIYDCDKLLQRSRVLTDVRPLFSDDASSIEGAVVSHTLRLRYDSAGNDREMSLALDDDDLRRLIEDCERALAKAETARAKMCLPNSIPTLKSNEVPHEH